LDLLGELSLVKPPYSRVTAIDLNTGEHVWMRATGRGAADRPDLRHLNLPDMGLDQYMFAIATPNLVFVAVVGPNWGADGYYADDVPKLWAFDPDSGDKVGEVPLPGRGRASMITYESDGRQYLVLSVGWGDRAELVALAIPKDGEELPFQPLGRDDADHELFYEAVEAFDAGDEDRLAQLLAGNDGLIHARGYLHEDSQPEFFRQATLLHHVAGDPTRAELQKNVLELAGIMVRAGADQPRWLNLKSELIELMLEAGADSDQGNGRLMHTALTNRHNGEIARLFHAKGASIDMRFAAALNLMVEVEAFFEPDGSLRADAVSRYHPSPEAAQMDDQGILNECLNYAASWGNIDIAVFLLTKGAEVNSLPPQVYCREDKGRTALHAAVSGERLEMVRFLLERGADPSIPDNNWDREPKRWAKWGGNQEIIDLLRDFGKTDSE